MLKLYGFPISNYYNMAKLALLEKGVDFDEVVAAPSQEEEMLILSPRGKIPFLETPEGFLSETITIMEYLEDLYPDPPLYPLDPYESGRVRQLIQFLELYVELPARRLLGHVIFGRELPELTRQEAREALELGLPAVARIARFSPFIAGDDFTAADIFAYYTGALAGHLTEQVYGENLMSQVKGYGEWFDMISQRPHVQAVNEVHQAAMVEFMKDK